MHLGINRLWTINCHHSPVSISTRYCSVHLWLISNITKAITQIPGSKLTYENLLSYFLTAPDERTIRNVETKQWMYIIQGPIVKNPILYFCLVINIFQIDERRV